MKEVITYIEERIEELKERGQNNHCIILTVAYQDVLNKIKEFNK